MAVSGNPQLNVRLERELLESVKQAADEHGMSAHEWVRRLIKEKLGLVKPMLDTIEDDEIEDRLSRLETELTGLRAIVAEMTKDVVAVINQAKV